MKYCRALYELALKLGSARALPTVLSLIVRNAAETLNLKACSLGLLDRETKEIEVVAAYGLGEEYTRGARIADIPLGRDAMKGRPVVVVDVGKTKPGAPSGVMSMLCVPLEMREKKTGVVCVYTAKRHRFTKAEVDFLKSIGNLGAVAVENARLHQQMQKRLQEISTIAEVSKTLSSSLKPQEVFNSIAAAAARSMEMKGCIVRLLDEKRERLELVASHGLSKEYIGKGPVHADKGLDDVRTGRPVAISDLLSDGRMEYPEGSVKEGIRSVLAVPLLSKGRVIGSIRVFGEEPHKFTDDEVRFMETLAGHASIAIENARLYRIALRNWQDLVDEVWEKSDVWGRREMRVEA